MPLTSQDLGEAYWCSADCGEFCLRFEAFGLTILKRSPACNDFHHSIWRAPQKLSKMEKMGFISTPTTWKKHSSQKFFWTLSISAIIIPNTGKKSPSGLIKRVRDKYNWQLHTNDLLLCAKNPYGAMSTRKTAKQCFAIWKPLFYLFYYKSRKNS